MIRTGKNPMLFGLLLIFMSGSILGQAPPSGDAGRAPAQPDAAPSQSKTEGSMSPRQHDDSYVIGNGDVLAINVWKDADLSRTIPVRSDGKISLPLVGEVQAAGRTPVQLESDITEKLKSYITSPVVAVMVEQVNSKKFSILGQVAKPGSYTLALATRITDAIATAGGFRDFAKEKHIYVLRQNPDGSQSRIDFNYKDFIKGNNQAKNIKLQPNDTVIVP
jgi:polysaccharide export outer membrane protein